MPRTKWRRRSTAAPKGFRLAEVETRQFHDHDSFFGALARQREGRVTVPAKAVQSVGIDGNIGSEGLRLTDEAFSSLCKLSKVPTSFVKALAKRNESLAMQVLQDGLDFVFPKDEVVLVVDTEHSRVEAVASEHEPFPHEQVMEWARSANPDMQLVRGWIHGALARMALVSPREHEAQVGDIVQVGVSVENDCGPLGFTSLTDYVERLSCSNGMTARDKSRMQSVAHSIDGLEDAVTAALVESGRRVTGLVPAMQRATGHFFDAKGVRAVREYLSDARRGGGRSLEARATRGAVEEARTAGRKEGEITLWDYVNGTTEAAKHQSSLEKRRNVEALGYGLLTSVLGPELHA